MGIALLFPAICLCSVVMNVNARRLWGDGDEGRPHVPLSLDPLFFVFVFKVLKKYWKSTGVGTGTGTKKNSNSKYGYGNG